MNSTVLFSSVLVILICPGSPIAPPLSCYPVVLAVSLQNKEREFADNLQLMTQKEEIEQKTKRVQQLKDSLQKMGLDRYEE